MTQEEPISVADRIASVLGPNAGYVLDVYALYRQSAFSVSERWQRYFERLESGRIDAENLPLTEATREAPAAEAPARPVMEPHRPVEGETQVPLRAAAARIVRNMEASLSVPTATSYRTVPVKVLEENRRFLNQVLSAGGEKVSITHLVAWAVVEAVKQVPVLNEAFAWIGGEPHRLKRPAIHLGVAVDLRRPDGSRNLIVPCIRNADKMDFRAFAAAYTETIRKARAGKLLPEDLQGTTLTLTNPGTIGTMLSLPRLMPGQGAIVAVGAIGYSAASRSMSLETLSELGISRSMTVSCTYDHRVIQGAESGEFLAALEMRLQGVEGFYDRIFESLGVPYHPIRWSEDARPGDRSGGGRSEDEIARQARVLQFINAYRVRGHLIAHLDPLGTRPAYHPELDPERYGLTIWDYDRVFLTGERPPGAEAWDSKRATLREIHGRLMAAYSNRIGIEYMNIQDPEQKRWIQERVEAPDAFEPMEPDELRVTLEKLIGSESFERFLHARFTGHKRFSLEGGETLVPILHWLLEEGANQGVEEVVLGMAHRGRLNVLTQVVGLDTGSILSEFQGTADGFRAHGSGDVKYHLGAKGSHHGANGVQVLVTVAPNPSHLEAVDPVVEGLARAKQDSIGAEEGRMRVLPVLVHGDAAFAGQGVVAETLNLSQLAGYRTGGTIHVIVNNQIGFTTPVESARSSPYPTDVAKMGQAPIFHVNGDDPEAAVRVVRWAFAFRQKFQKDVVIDMFCYRRWGHNEGDEPSYTQPRLYAKIKDHPSVAHLFAERLERLGAVSAEEVEAMRAKKMDALEASFRGIETAPKMQGRGSVAPGTAVTPLPTSVPHEVLARLTRALTSPPADLDVHPKLTRWIERRKEVLKSGEGVDWAFAEALAFGSLVLEGVPIRLSGQDSVRGTFSQRHLLLRDDDTDVSWMALQHVDPKQARFSAIDSPLSEEAVLAFEYGYSLGDPSVLVLWEAQFGDFVNEAQVVIDQFLVGSEAKWGQPSGVTLLLPHGYEGQGPDHSTARLERFLQLAAEDNLQVAAPTTPAQYFHLLRRQMVGRIRKPLIVMTPKSLLRHPEAQSPVEALTTGGFGRVLPDIETPARRLVLCSGKLYYDLAEARRKEGRKDVALVRVEQLYPFPEAEILDTIRFHEGATVVWAQEEPRNMGAWSFMADRLRRLSVPIEASYAGRPESASTATGYHAVHVREQEAVVAEALG